MRVLVVDDEKPARKRLISYLSDYPEAEIIGEAENGAEAVCMANELKPEVIFLDIQMPKGDGFQVVAELMDDPVIIFTTAYDEYAIEAFSVHALDYLLKPYSKERFSQAITQLKKIMINPNDYNTRTRDAVDSISPGVEFLKRVSVRDNHVYTIVPVENILTIKTIGGLVFIQVNDRTYQTDTTLNQFEQRLDPQKYMRIHRSAIVNLEKIVKLMPWGQGRIAVTMLDNSSIQVSRDRMKEFKRRIGLKL